MINGPSTSGFWVESTFPTMLTCLLGMRIYLTIRHMQVMKLWHAQLFVIGVLSSNT